MTVDQPGTVCVIIADDGRPAMVVATRAQAWAALAAFEVCAQWEGRPSPRAHTFIPVRFVRQDV